jgi:hypothetical protein
MKRRVLSKTTSFHFFFKKKRREQNGVVLNDIVPLSSSPGHAAGEERKLLFFFFFNFVASLSLPACSIKNRSPTPFDDEKPGEPRLASRTHWPTDRRCPAPHAQQ